jgi:glycosyltransferase involved in cell wall biosynthesis
VRILLATHHASRVAGAETYVATAIGALAARGHDLALLTEQRPVPGREAIAGAQVRWCAMETGESSALADARRWAPDLVFVQGLASVHLERAAMALAPAVLFAHAYAGLCVSGSRTWQSSDTICSRVLGPGCLVHYFPHRCGGLSPTTMVRDYVRQRARQELHRQYRAIVVASRHMASAIAPGGPPPRIHVLPPPVPPPAAAAPRGLQVPIRLLYIGRLERLKGVHLLFDAAREAAERLKRGVELHIAGDGPLRTPLEAHARALVGRIHVIFDGWQTPAQRDALMAASDLVVLPSLWPEPYGLVGMEAARFGVPAVAFASGGIPEWLHDGVNGTIAAGRTPHGLADAIVTSVGDESAYRRLSAGALDAVAGASAEAHAARLERVFEEALC